MAPTSAVPSAPSASKLRRQRAKTTNAKLFLAADDSKPLQMINSQLAILTSSLDLVVDYIYASGFSSTSATSYQLNPFAASFVPSGAASIGAAGDTSLHDAVPKRLSTNVEPNGSL